MNHLLDECIYTKKILDWVAGIFRQSDRTRGNIFTTINNWHESYNKNEEVNLCWTLILGMIIWTIWKEMNRCIFKNEILWEGNIKEKIISMTRETVQSRNYQNRKEKLASQDSRVLEAFHLKDGCNCTQIE
jgi:hypothetical protein